MDFTNTTINDFIDYIIQYDDIDTVLNECNSQSEKGFIYERLWDLIIKFGFCHVFPNSNFTHKIGNVNTGKIRDLKFK